MTFSLESAAFGPGQLIPRKYIRQGDNLSPPLKWAGAPRETKSYLLIVEDPDAPGGTFRNWALFDIDPSCDHLDEATGRGAGHGVNDFGNIRYDGPQPPKGHGAHHYHFRLAALDVPSLGLGDGANINRIWDRAQGHILDQAELVGIYEAI
jgi:Raf kinase inhibitor-like YbhB/YbcL family protein